MYWYEYLIILLILVSVWGGLSRGFFKSIFYYGHYLLAPFFIGRFSQPFAQFLLEKLDLVNIFCINLQEACYQPFLQLSKIPINIDSILENWELFTKEIVYFLEDLSFPVFVKELVLSLLQTDTISEFFIKQSTSMENLGDLAIRYVGHMFASYLSLSISIIIIFLVIFVVFRLIMLLTSFNAKLGKPLAWLNRIGGGLWSGTMKILFLSMLLIVIQPTLLFLVADLQGTRLYNFFWQLALSCRPWLEGAILKMYMGVGS